MFKTKLILVACSTLLIFSACAQNESNPNKPKEKENQEASQSSKYEKAHPYGGWFCPDNFGGFPPIDLTKINEISVVADRLPTQEETRNGAALMYFDPEEYPEAKALDFQLPRLARIHSKHNNLEEYIVIIQAAAIGEDTVVGFRYPSGGNGTAWLAEVDMLSDSEFQKIPRSPFVYQKLEISSNTQAIWKAIGESKYGKNLKETYGHEEFFESDWSSESFLHLNHENKEEKSTGIIADMYGNFFLHIDKTKDNTLFTQKILIINKDEEKTAEMHLVSGPYLEGVEQKSAEWTAWLNEIKKAAESDE